MNKHQQEVKYMRFRRLILTQHDVMTALNIRPSTSLLRSSFCSVSSQRISSSYRAGLSAVIMWVGLGLCAAELHAL